jgi:hypothetical protein
VKNRRVKCFLLLLCAVYLLLPIVLTFSDPNASKLPFHVFHLDDSVEKIEVCKGGGKSVVYTGEELDKLVSRLNHVHYMFWWRRLFPRGGWTYGIYVYGDGKNGPPYTFGENFVRIGEMTFFSVGNEFTELLDETGIR